MWRVLPVPCVSQVGAGIRTELLSEPVIVGITCTCGHTPTLCPEPGMSEVQCACGRQFRVDGPTVHVWEPVTIGVEGT